MGVEMTKTDETMQMIEAVFSVGLEPVIGILGDKIVFCNSAAESTFGRKLIGLPADSVVPDGILRGMHIQLDSYLCNDVFDGIAADASVTRFNGYLIIKLSIRDEKPATLAFTASLSALLISEVAILKNEIERLTFSPELKNAPKLEEYKLRANRTIHKLTRLVKNMTLLESLLSKSYTAKMELWDLCLISRELVSSVSPLIEEMNIQIVFKHYCYDKNGNEQALHINADRELIERMLMCLFTNSVKSIGSNGQICLELYRTDKHARFVIKDSGDGIPISKLGMIFAQHAWERSAMQIAEGAGLGLSLAKEIASLHGGTLVVPSSEGTGASVYLDLPIDDERVKNIRTPMHYDLNYAHILAEFSSVIGIKHFDGRYSD